MGSGVAASLGPPGHRMGTVEVCVVYRPDALGDGGSGPCGFMELWGWRERGNGCCECVLLAERVRFGAARGVPCWGDCGGGGVMEFDRAIRTARLHALLHFHLRPIDVVVFHGPWGDLVLRLVSRLDAFSGYPFRT